MPDNLLLDWKHPDNIDYFFGNTGPGYMNNSWDHPPFKEQKRHYGLSEILMSIVLLLCLWLFADKVVGTICHGAWMLCSAKCIKGKKLTCFHAIKDDVENAG